jgi:hypothetical protein
LQHRKPFGAVQLGLRRPAARRKHRLPHSSTSLTGSQSSTLLKFVNNTTGNPIDVTGTTT